MITAVNIASGKTLSADPSRTAEKSGGKYRQQSQQLTLTLTPSQRQGQMEGMEKTTSMNTSMGDQCAPDRPGNFCEPDDCKLIIYGSW